jgi:hypothetical protein
MSVSSSASFFGMFGASRQLAALVAPPCVARTNVGLRYSNLIAMVEDDGLEPPTLCL